MTILLYRCGCSDPSGKNCFPSNDTTSTQWAGRFTDNSTNPPTVYVGWAELYGGDSYFACPDSVYCPGRNGDTGYCPSLCDAGHYCPDPASKIVCDEGSFCLVGSTEPTECTALTVCSGTGNTIDRPVWGNIIILATVVVSFGWLYISHRRLNKSFPFTKTSQTATKPEGNVEEGAEGHFENNSTKRTIPGPPSTAFRPSVITTPEPAYKIDVSFSELQLTLPNGKCIMQGVSGALKSGQFTAIMGPR